MENEIDETFYEVNFVLGLRKSTTAKGVTTVRAFRASTTEPNKLEVNERLLRVKIDVPESLWAMPVIKGRLESRLIEEFEAFIEEAKE